jgi:hypothetical protein
LPAKASTHSTLSSPLTPLSRASSLPRWSGADQQSLSQPKSLWERACSRRLRHIQPHHRLSHRFREQARSHNGPVQGRNLQRNQNPCGSGLAREGAGTFNIIIACNTAFASRLAPTVIRGRSTIFVAPQIPCGSGLAREGAGTFKIIIACHTAFASKLAPTMVRCKATIFSATKTPVGAGLPAKAPAHSTSSSPVTPLSRAGSLLQRSGGRSAIFFATQIPVGASLLAKAPDRIHSR